MPFLVIPVLTTIALAGCDQNTPSKSSGVEVETMDISRLTVLSRLLSRIAQESLAKVDRHRKGSRVEVNIQKMSDGIFRKIHGHGISFKVDDILGFFGGKRLGQLGTKERLKTVGGHFHIESLAGKGTLLIAQMPF
jgi:signal transduction histidine kinase